MMTLNAESSWKQGKIKGSRVVYLQLARGWVLLMESGMTVACWTEVWVSCCQAGGSRICWVPLGQACWREANTERGKTKKRRRYEYWRTERGEKGTVWCHVKKNPKYNKHRKNLNFIYCFMKAVTKPDKLLVQFPIQTLLLDEQGESLNLADKFEGCDK